MKVLLTNDDGYQTEGLLLLRQKLLETGHQVWLVAPAENRSACGHALSRKLEIVEHQPRLYSCSGFPADCVLIALLKLLKEKPDLVISGPNEGANLADDVTSSGTVAAAREAASAQIPAIALSMTGAPPFDFASGIHFVLNNLDFFQQKWQNRHFWNINVPPQAVESAFTTLGRRTYENTVSPLSDSHFSIIGKAFDVLDAEDSKDVCAVKAGKVSVSLVSCATASKELSFSYKDLDNSSLAERIRQAEDL